jgi:hypothetical protein
MGDQHRAIAQLYRALGGGFIPEEPRDSDDEED